MIIAALAIAGMQSGAAAARPLDDRECVVFNDMGNGPLTQPCRNLPEAHGADVPGDLEMSPYLPLANEGLCRLAPRGEIILEALLGYDRAKDRWATAGPLPLPDGRIINAVVTTKTVAAAEGVERTTSVVVLPPGTTWHGLPLRSIELAHVSVPESDDSDWRTMTFDAPATQLRARMRAIGQEFPMAPLYREIPGGDDRCDGAANIERDGASRSRLTCNWGC